MAFRTRTQAPQLQRLLIPALMSASLDLGVIVERVDDGAPLPAMVCPVTGSVCPIAAVRGCPGVTLN